PAVACGGFSMLYLIGQAMTYHHLPFIDALFPEKTSYNVIGTVEPRGEVKRTVIISGHHDSQYEFNLFYYLKTFGGAVVFLGFGGIVLMTIVFLLRLILLVLSIQLTVFFIVFMVICIIFIPIACMCMSFVNMNKPVMGAFDNLSAISILLAVGKHFASMKLENTRLMLISFAGDEAGLRGSSAFIKAHLGELQASEHLVVNLDGIGEKDKVIFTRTEALVGIVHDKWMNEQMMGIAKELGIKARLGPLPFGTTDAARFSKAKIKTTNINAFDLGAHLPYYYHNRNDTLDVVDKEALAQVYDIVVEFIKRVD
nr:M28 family peptidase [Candidatus Sigynarchaeota archaeon]